MFAQPITSMTGGFAGLVLRDGYATCWSANLERGHQPKREAAS